MVSRQHWVSSRDVFYTFLLSNPYVSFFYHDKGLYCYYDARCEKIFCYDPVRKDVYECGFFKNCANLMNICDSLNFHYVDF